MSKKLRRHTSGALCAGGALLMGCLWATAAQAQNTPAIRPLADPMADLAPAPGTVPGVTAPAPVPERVAPPLAPPGEAKMEMSFRDIPIKDVLLMLGSRSNMNLVVNDDVDGVLSSVNLSNLTPEEALQTVVASARNLSLTRLPGPNGTYLISKALPGERPQINFNNGAQTAPFNAPSTDSAFRSITPAQTDFSNFGGEDRFGGQGLAGALPQIGMGAGNEFPTLVNPQNSARNAKERRTIRVRNVKPSVIAYWLDPAHNPMPEALQVSNLNAGDYGNKSLARPGFGDGSAGILGNNGVTGGGSVTPSPFGNSSNPYLRNFSASQMRPNSQIETRSNAQFGGGNFGGGGGGNQFGGAQNGQNGQNGGGGTFDLPGDIQQILSVDPQNVLLVAGGSDEDVRNLQNLIDVLDQPLRQVEIEAQFVELSTQDSRALGVNFTTSRGNFDASSNLPLTIQGTPVAGSISVGFVRGNFQTRLDALIANNRAKVITAPRVTAINNLTATLQSQETRPLILTTVQQNIGGGQQAGQNLIGITNTIGLTVTPTINGDDTVTVLMEPRVTTQSGNTGLGVQTSRFLRTIANVRDGDTIALGGLKRVSNERNNTKIPLLGDLPLIGGLFRSSTLSETETELIVFLTARIVRRAGDDGIVPGT